jgi:signal transduction histidine kinase
MRLQTKLTLASAGIISALGLAVGGVAVAAIESSALARIDKVLESSEDTVAGEPKDKIAAALLVASEAGDALEVGYIDPGGDLSNLATSTEIVHTRPTVAQLKHASKQAISITSNGESYRLRAFALSDDDWVIFAMSLNEVTVARTTGLLAMGGATAAAVLLGAVAIAMIVRREARKIARLTGEAERISQGELSQALTVEEGTSEVDQLSRALEEMVASLQQAVVVEKAAQARMQEFLGDASHELRTPLTVVRGYLEMITKPDLPAEARERAYERMGAEIQRMERLIRDLLQIAELSEATSSMALVDEVDFSKVVATAADDLSALQPARPLELEVEPGLTVAGREDLLRQLLINIMGNIGRHTKAEHAVRIHLASDGSWAQLDVDDAGPGLPAEAYSQGIDAFKRFDPSRSREHGGSGLGMSIIQGIVRTLGGEISLTQSELGGLHTCIRLPLAV